VRHSSLFKLPTSSFFLVSPSPVVRPSRPTPPVFVLTNPLYFWVDQLRLSLLSPEDGGPVLPEFPVVPPPPSFSTLLLPFALPRSWFRAPRPFFPLPRFFVTLSEELLKFFAPHPSQFAFPKRGEAVPRTQGCVRFLGILRPTSHFPFILADFFFSNTPSGCVEVPCFFQGPLSPKGKGPLGTLQNSRLFFSVVSAPISGRVFFMILAEPCSWTLRPEPHKMLPHGPLAY